MTHSFVVVGSGTAGAIAAAYLKRYWGDAIRVTVVYDRSKPAIGVGESTTPFVFNFLDRVGISFADLVRETGSTVKLGIKFKNWLGDGGYYYHNFIQPDRRDRGDMGAKFAARIAEGLAFEAESTDGRLMELGKVPHTAYTGGLSFAVHLDSLEFSRFVERQMSDSVEFIDGVVDRVKIEDGKIIGLTLSDGTEISGDFYIDASGLARTLIGKLDATWNDRKGYLPVDRAIPNPIPRDNGPIEPYTLAEATDNGWIWQVPLTARYGSGYVYSSLFTSDSEAREDFDRWLRANHGVGLSSDRIIDFSCGYYEQAWAGNCLAVGLAGGFVEPLESTSIHITTMQVREFCMRYTLRNLKYDQDSFNRYMSTVWEDTVDFVRFHYFTGRRDTEFWTYIDDTTPQWARDLKEKLANDCLNDYYFKSSTIFERQAWSFVANGLGMMDADASARYLALRNLRDDGLGQLYWTASQSPIDERLAADHSDFLSFLSRR